MPQRLWSGLVWGNGMEFIGRHKPKFSEWQFILLGDGGWRSLSHESRQNRGSLIMFPKFGSIQIKTYKYRIKLLVSDLIT